MTAGAQRVSIVMLVHDGARVQREAIDAVLGRTFVDWELLIVDHASMDGSPGIIAETTARNCAEYYRAHRLRVAAYLDRQEATLPSAISSDDGRLAAAVRQDTTPGSRSGEQQTRLMEPR